MPKKQVLQAKENLEQKAEKVEKGKGEGENEAEKKEESKELR